MSVATVTEISVTSTQSFEDAIRQGIERVTKTLRGVTSAWVKEQQVRLRNGKVAEYQVNLQITFILDDEGAGHGAGREQREGGLRGVSGRVHP